MRELNQFNFRHLYYFWTIAREGSIKRASEVLHLTPPGLSEQLKVFETSLEAKLFERRPRKLVLTPIGEVLYGHAGEIFSKTEELLRAVSARKEGDRTLLRVGVVPSLSHATVGDILLPFMKRKTLMLTIREASSERLLQDLERGGLDAVLCDTRPSTRPGQERIRLSPRKIVVVGIPKFEKLKKGFPESLDGAPMIHPSRQTRLGEDLDFLLRKWRVTPKIVGEAEDLSLLRIAAEAGVGVTVLPLPTIRGPLQRGKLIKIGQLSEIQAHIWAIWTKEGEKAELMRRHFKRFKEEERSP